MVLHCVLNKTEISFHYKKYERNGSTIISMEKIKNVCITKSMREMV